MPTTFSLFYLGVAPEIDTIEGNVTSENHNALNGLVFGSAGSPLAFNLQTLSPISFAGGSNAAAYEADNTLVNETFSIDGGAARTHDTTMLYNNTVITYTDGTTAIVNAIVMQDTAGNLYLLPPTVANTYSTALEAKPIQSITLGTAAPANGTDTYGMTADRYVLTVSDYTVEGTAGNDFIDAGYAGDPEGDFVDATDHIDGTNNDSVEAGAGNDTVLSGAGNDTVLGGDGNDSLLGEAGNDSLVGENGNDTLIGGAGADTLDGGAGLDFVDYSASGAAVTVDLTTNLGSGGDAEGDVYAGVDGIVGSVFGDTLIGYDAEFLTGSPDDYTNVIDGGAGNDFIDGRAGSDSLFGGAGSDTVLGGDGNDSMLGGTGIDSLDGGIGDDTIFGQDGSDTIFGGDGNDSLDGDDALATGGGDSIDGGAGNDTIIGDAGRDTLLDGSGADSVFGGDDADTIVMGTGNDIHFGEADDDIFIVQDGFGTDTVVGGETTTTGTDFDTLDFHQITTGGVSITASGTESGTATVGTNTIQYSEIEAFTLTNQADTVDASGSTVGVTVSGLGGNDTITGGSGNDTLSGGDGNDDLIGGAGNDSLVGGAGFDEYVFADGWGTDTVADSNFSGLEFTSVTTGITLTTTGANAFSATDGTNSVSGTIGDQSYLELSQGDDLVDLSGQTTQTIQFIYGDFSGAADNDTIIGSDFDDQVYVVGDGGTYFAQLGGGNDYIEGTDQNDTVFGEDGNDTLRGFGGNDYLDGGAGDDQFYNSEGNDTLIGGAGNDWFFADFGSNQIYGGTGNDTIEAGDGDDTIFMEDGFGNDVITGGETAETNGDTLDLSAVTTATTIDLTSANPESGTVSDGTSTATFTEIETIVLGGGRDTIVLADGSGSDTVQGFDLTDSGDGTTVDRLDVSGLTDAGGNPVNVADVTVTDTNGDGTGDAILTFPNGESITLVGVLASQVDDPAELEAMGIPAVGAVDGTAGDDVMNIGFTDAQGDQVDGTDGLDDTIYGFGGNDSITSGLGADTVFGGDGNDQINAGDGDDSLSGDAGNDLIFADAGNDTVDGGAGDDILNASAGNDSLLGGDGADRFVFQVNHGTDTIVGGEGGTDDDTLVMQFQADPVVITYTGNEAGTLTMAGTSATFTEIEAVELSAGNDSLDATADSLGVAVDGFGGDDTITGGSGSDTVDGGAGNDLLSGGAGADSLFGSDGDDTIALADGFGNDTITGGELGETGGDTLDLSAVTTATTIDLTNANPELGTVSDGTSIATFSEIENIVLGGGRDTIVLADGSGADTVSGFDLTDSGDGTTVDQLDVSGLTDAGGNPVSTEDVIVTDTNGDGTGDAILTFPGGESITLVGVLSSAVSSPAQLAAIGIPAAGGDFTVEGTAGADLINAAYLGDPDGDLIDNNDHADGSNDDSVVAGDGDDTIDAGAGDDTILGGSGDDEIFLDVTLQNDSITGGETGETLGDRLNLSTITADTAIVFSGPEAGTITDGTSTTTFSEIERFQLGTGSDSVVGSTGNEEIIGNAGDDTILGGGGDDTIFSGFDNDSVSGGDGNDSILTSTGADIVEGGAGNDTIDVGAADGVVDTVILADGFGADVLSGFEAPIDNGDGTFTGQDLFDVTGLTDLDGNPVTTEDVTVTDDGSGNAVLSFPNGEQVTLAGVPVSAVQDPLQLEAMGIPLFAGDFIVEGAAGADLIDAAYLGDPEGDRIDNADGVGGSQADTVVGFDGNDTIFGLADDDVLYGGDGITNNDGAQPFDGDDLLDGGAGNDTLFGENGNDTLIGGLGDDNLDGSLGNDSLVGGDGNDSFAGGAGDDTIDGGTGNDYIFADGLGQTGNDSILAGDGADTVFGLDGTDTILGGAGADLIDGGGDEDLIVVEAGFGNDTISGGETATTGVDFDTLDLSAVTDPLSILFTGNEAGTVTDGADTLAFSGIEQLVLGDGNETIDATAVATPILLDGAGGDDSIAGGSAGDTLIGGLGTDTLTGGTGDDSLTGGDGNDVFTYVAGDGNDTITDFNSGNTGTLADGDPTNNDFIDLSAFYDGIWELHADQADDGILNQSNTTTTSGGAVDYSDNAQFGTGSLTFAGAIGDPSFFNAENTNVACFTTETLIKTARGEVRAAEIRVGDRVLTRDNGYQPVCWKGERALSAADLAANPGYRPVRIPAGALGRNMPERDLLVSPQHRVLVDGPAVQLHFGEEEVLVAAIHLVGWNGITRAEADGVRYVHFLCARHEIVQSDGAWTESFQPGDQTLRGLDGDQRDELFALFPELAEEAGREAYEAARPALRAYQARLLVAA